MKKINDHNRSHLGKLLAATAVCLIMFSGITDTLSINTYVHDLKGMAVPVQSYAVDAHVVALTFDIGAGSDDLAGVLNQLDGTKVKATFFLTGVWLEKNPRTAKEIVKRGHEVGRSLYTYRQPSGLSLDVLKQEMEKTDAAWRMAALPETHLFRAPYGETRGSIAKLARDRGDQLISYSVNAAPGVWQSDKEALSGIEDAIKPGDILRMGADAPSVKALPRLMQRIQAAGYDWRTLSHMQKEGGER
ncbi:MAG: polysaccharide deacetylase family protein [Tumebacillaceae bacterium]